MTYFDHFFQVPQKTRKKGPSRKGGQPVEFFVFFSLSEKLRFQKKWKKRYRDKEAFFKKSPKKGQKWQKTEKIRFFVRFEKNKL